ncbi:MAG: GIY-YIG nuclease family protein [Acidimicrobiia bacterium]
MVEKSLWTGLGFMAPRSRYGSLRARPELNGAGVYVLIGPPDGVAASSRIYIGESDVLRDRLDNHHANKDFWTRVIVFTAKDANLNKAHVRYLEARLLRISAETKRAEVDNSSMTSLPGLSEADTADMEAFLADMRLIYPVLGLNAFDTPAEDANIASTPRLRLVGKDTQAEGQETAEGFVVYAGSIGRRDAVPSIHAYGEAMRRSLIDEGLFVIEGEHLRLTQDYVFTSPSTAAMVMLGRTSNGRLEWKDPSGVSLSVLQERSVAD